MIENEEAREMLLDEMREAMGDGKSATTTATYFLDEYSRSSFGDKNSGTTISTMTKIMGTPTHFEHKAMKDYARTDARATLQAFGRLYPRDGGTTCDPIQSLAVELRLATQPPRHERRKAAALQRRRRKSGRKRF